MEQLSPLYGDVWNMQAVSPLMRTGPNTVGRGQSRHWVTLEQDHKALLLYKGLLSHIKETRRVQSVRPTVRSLLIFLMKKLSHLLCARRKSRQQQQVDALLLLFLLLSLLLSLLFAFIGKRCVCVCVQGVQPSTRKVPTSSSSSSFSPAHIDPLQWKDAE